MADKIMDGRDAADEVLAMLDKAHKINLEALLAVDALKGHAGFQFEGLPELLRAQIQNALALTVQARTIWTAQRRSFN